MKRKIITALVSITILWFSFPSESLAAEECSMPTEITEIADTEDSVEPSEDSVNNETNDGAESSEEISGAETNDDSVENLEEIDKTKESEETEKSEEIDESEENTSEEESTDSETETETIVETHSENHCTIIVSYTKEVYDDPFARLDTTELSLKSTYELVESQSADEFIQNIENDDIKMILSKVSFDDDFTNGYIISASIDVDNNVTIKSIKKTEKQEVVTEVEVEVTSANESEPLDEE